MIHQSLKDLYYLFFLPVSRGLLPFYRWHYRRFRAHLDRLHLGCGEHYLDGFVNLDGNFRRGVDYLCDVRAGLPFPSGRLRFIYSCHMLEHLHVDEACRVLAECRRVLHPEGRMRLTLPDFRHALAILQGGATSSFPRGFVCAEGMAINFLFCDGQHKYAYGAESLRELALQVGFSRVEVAELHRSPEVGDFTEPVGSFSVHLYP
ncbi:MAG: methyltransferase domain-containing protein [Magnetococcales bacterium]|nr:methyltransferase domain-containing protein [Magnetococcales bacterium]